MSVYREGHMTPTSENTRGLVITLLFKLGILCLMYVFLSEKAIIVIAMGLWIIQKAIFRWELNEEMSAEERRDYETWKKEFRN